MSSFGKCLEENRLIFLEGLERHFIHFHIFYRDGPPYGSRSQRKGQAHFDDPSGDLSQVKSSLFLNTTGQG